MKDPLNILKFISERITKSWKTTVFGSILFLIGLATLVVESILLEWWQSLIICLVGVFLAAMKDPKNNNTGLATILIVGLVSAFTSCATEKRCMRLHGGNTTTVVKDSIVRETKIEYKDSIVTIPGDSVYISLPSPCDSLGNLIENYKHEIRSGKKAYAKITAKDNRLIVECGCDEEKRTIEKLNKTITQLETHSSTTTTVKELKVKHIPWYARWWVLLTALAVGWLDGKFGLIRKLISLIK